jgi:hypothetical protein
MGIRKRKLLKTPPIINQNFPDRNTRALRGRVCLLKTTE